MGIIRKVEPEEAARELKQSFWLMKNHREITAPLDITTYDIMKKLREQGIDATPGNIAKVAQQLRRIAAAWAQAQLQDTKDWREWIED